MRIAVGQLWQETNTFNPLPTTRADFEDFGLWRGAQVIEQMSGTNELGGFIQSLRGWQPQPQIVGLARLAAWPSGAATAETFDWLREELLRQLRQALPVDAVLLALHGSLVAEDHPDVEGEILALIRREIGPKIPLVATLDLHANVTRTMVEQAHALVLYHTSPHVDVYETGVRAAALLRKILVAGARPVSAWTRIPFVPPAERANTQNAASVSHGLKQRLEALEARPGVLSAGLATVQPWLDIPDLGSSALVVTDGDPEFSQTACADLAREIWDRREDYLPTLVPLAEAVRAAHAACAQGLVVLSDSADATTSGAPGDSNWIPRELLRYSWPRPALVTVVAPDLVGAAECLGAGRELQGSLGGVRDHRFSRPIDFRATVECVFDARFVLSGHHLGRNLAIDMGRSAVLRHENVWVVATSRTGPHFAPELFQAAGIDPFQASVLVAKSPCGFRAVYEPRAVKIMVVQAPGCAPSDFWNYPYQRIPRPLWPWDKDLVWQPDVVIAARAD